MFIISDLHMGDGSEADDFGPANGPADHDLIEFVERAGPGHPIGIAGDLLELWQCSLSDVLEAHGAALEALMWSTRFYVCGNHDSAMLGGRLFGVQGVPFYAGANFYCEHGHWRDPVVGKWPRVSRAFCAVGGWLERCIHHDADVWAESAGAWLSGTGRHGENRPYLRPVLAEARAFGKSIAVFGHTHKLLLSLGVYNCGTWTNGRRDVICIEEPTEERRRG